MLRFLMKSKLHRATVTAANLNYVGSITIASDLMDAAELLENERVEVLNINNGARFNTYTMRGRSESGEICLNGAAARLVVPGDFIIILSYGMYSDDEASRHVPIVVLCDDKNRPSMLQEESASRSHDIAATKAATLSR